MLERGFVCVMPGTKMCSLRECVLTGRGIVSGSASLQQRARSLDRSRARRKGRRERRWCAHARTGGGRKVYEIDSRRGSSSKRRARDLSISLTPYPLSLPPLRTRVAADPEKKMRETKPKKRTRIAAATQRRARGSKAKRVRRVT